jgi:pimeloyl-ACP methyl ester carboxylesterase
LFIHGWPLYSVTFRAIVPRLSERFTCHLFDLPGTGISEWGPDAKISLVDHAQSARKVVDHLRLGDYAVVAHDSGAVIAQLLAANDSRVRGLVLGNTEIPGHHPWQLSLYVALDRLPFGPQLLGAALQVRAIRQSQLAFGFCFHDPNYVEGEFRELFLRPMRESRRNFEGQRRLIQSFSWQIVDELARTRTRIQAPTQFIWGAQDPCFPLAKLEPALSAFPGGASLAVIDPGKLFAHEEFPEVFASHAREFLETCWAERESSVTSRSA